MKEATSSRDLLKTFQTMTAEAFLAFPAVEIESGVFKYVQIRLYRDDGKETREEKDLVRGWNWGQDQ